MKAYKKMNNLLGWLVFAVAAAVYIITSEPTASFWDCGEYIATAYKLQVGHPPGAPTFQLIGRFFTLFAFGDTALVARMVNTLSALVSAFSILFLFWSITHLARKIFTANNTEIIKEKTWAILGSGLVGALAYTFSDSFWFSAVEGEVYATSSFFTAIVFWAILKWEDEADSKYALRWLILIAYLVGLSIGVHLLNLLAIPAMVFVYYFKKYKTSKKEIFVAFIFSIILLFAILYVIIPLIVLFAGKFELFAVNSMRLPFNSGTIIYFILLIGGIIWGLRYSYKKRKEVMHAIMLSFTFLLIGYSTFLVLVIRSNSDTPIDENNPEDAVGLLSYLRREQYGETPLVYGQYFNAPRDMQNPAGDGSPVYVKDRAKGKYVIVDAMEGIKSKYDKRFCTVFPRMHSPDAPRGGDAYKEWVKIEGTPISVDVDGRKQVINKPTFSENLTYFFRYQLGHMYFRYFMWNFAGRQNDIQGYRELVNGNWLTGINFLDEMRLGPQKGLPEHRKNAGRNKFYLLPLILGIAGLLYHIQRHSKDAFVVFLLFFFTGIAIVIYLNQAPNEPRERDYAYAASFYAFAIWIGIGVLALYEWLRKKLSEKISAVAATLLCLVLVPGIMAKNGWDDHDRSNRYMALAMAKNYLNSCAPNAILFTNGDNDTFPLWYAQEVEGIRTDVRVVNLSLLSSDWFVAMIKRKAYDSDPVPSTISTEQYKTETYKYIPVVPDDNLKGNIDLKKIIDFVASDDPRSYKQTQMGKIKYFPTTTFRMPVDSAYFVDNGIIPKEKADSILKNVDWRLGRGGYYRHILFTLDFLATNNWKRPIYFSSSMGSDSYMGLQQYFHQEGFAYRVLPMKARSSDRQTGQVNTAVMYENLMKKFEFGNIEKPDVYLDETCTRMTINLKNLYSRLANALLDEGKTQQAIEVMDYCLKYLPENKFPYNQYVIPFMEHYYRAGATEKANYIAEKLIANCKADLDYFYTFTGHKSYMVLDEKQTALGILHQVARVTEINKNTDLKQQAQAIFDEYYPKFDAEMNRVK